MPPLIKADHAIAIRVDLREELIKLNGRNRKSRIDES